MADEQQLKSLCKAMDCQTRRLQQKVAVAQTEVLALDQQKQLITGSQRSSALNFGHTVNALSCWNRNQFSALVNDVLLLLDQKLAAKQQNFEQLETSLEEQKKKTRVLEHLSHKEHIKNRKRADQLMKRELEEVLQRY
ncbi:hypothetical protein [Endozoicomonas sp. SCSIO W0465]|uniref:hypothetical protein n=1 Tax=Endozoicomonas sp. SCSIO W0465 TaxID=2918516 RepID=UPI002074F2F5|nr:hypothetical protein [Endozoicomonas sp. SCSIO W0465]USE37636.1 hypothetical protein MJO57_05330 [Endozoicomonas sp. SCSIO W0465]